MSDLCLGSNKSKGSRSYNHIGLGERMVSGPVPQPRLHSCNIGNARRQPGASACMVPTLAQAWTVSVRGGNTVHREGLYLRMGYTI